MLNYVDVRAGPECVHRAALAPNCIKCGQAPTRGLIPPLVPLRSCMYLAHRSHSTLEASLSKLSLIRLACPVRHHHIKQTGGFYVPRATASNQYLAQLANADACIGSDRAVREAADTSLRPSSGHVCARSANMAAR